MVTEEKEGDAAAEEDEDAHEMDQSDGLVQVRDLLLLLHSYASGALGRPCEMRLQTLCVGPLNTAWGPEDMPVAAVTAAGLAVAAHSGANSGSAATAAPLSFPRPLLTSLFLHVPSGQALGHMPYGRGDRGPDMVLRTLRGGVGPPEELSHVYREEQDRFEIRAFRHENMHVSPKLMLMRRPRATWCAVLRRQLRDVCVFAQSVYARVLTFLLSPPYLFVSRCVFPLSHLSGAESSCASLPAHR